MSRAAALAALAALAAAPAAAGSGPVRSATATASATIVEPLALAPGAPLTFGLLKGGSAAGSVVVRPQGLRAAAGGAEMVGSGPCHTAYCEDDSAFSNPDSASYWGPGVFEVRGFPGASFRLSGAASAAAYLRVPAAGRLPQLYVRSFTFVCRSTGQAGGVLDSSGRDTCRSGGTIDIPAGMKTGSYRVNVPISVEYF